MTQPLLPCRDRRVVAAALAPLLFAVATAGPLAHRPLLRPTSDAIALTAPHPDGHGAAHDPATCVLCQLQAGRYAPASTVPPARVSHRAHYVAVPATPAPPPAAPRWRLLPRAPPPSNA